MYVIVSLISAQATKLVRSTLSFPFPYTTEASPFKLNFKLLIAAQNIQAAETKCSAPLL